MLTVSTVSFYVATDKKVLTNVPQVNNLMTPIVLDTLNCRGTEASLGQCEHAAVVEYCTHSQDAGANCTIIKGIVTSAAYSTIIILLLQLSFLYRMQ